VDIAIVTETSEETQRLHVALIGLLPSAKIERLANYSSSSRHPANSLPYHYVITSDEELATKPAWRRSIEMGLDLLTGHRDRDAPHRVPLPHHLACGSVQGGG
jgi:hypothetical protein